MRASDRRPDSGLPRADQEVAAIRFWFRGRSAPPLDLELELGRAGFLEVAQRVRAAPAPASRCAR